MSDLDPVHRIVLPRWTEVAVVIAGFGVTFAGLLAIAELVSYDVAAILAMTGIVLKVHHRLRAPTDV